MAEAIIDNYEELHAWLLKRGFSKFWPMALPPVVQRNSCALWASAEDSFIVLLFADQRGYRVYGEVLRVDYVSGIPNVEEILDAAMAWEQEDISGGG